MRASKRGSPLLLAVLAAASLPALPDRSSQLWAAPQADKFEDLAQFEENGRGVVSGTSIRDKGGFTVVPMQAAAGCSKLCVSFAVKADQKRTGSDFRVVAVDAAGKRHRATDENWASAGGNGITVITVVSEFNLPIGKLESLVIQQRVRPKK